MTNEIEKSEQPKPDDVLAAITSFNDVSIITNIFRDLGWTYSIEIQETLALARQNANLSIKFKAIKHLRELLREAAEASGYTANVSSTMPNAQGGTTTFHAKRIASALNPTKQIDSIIKEPENDKQEIRTESDRGSNRGTSQDNKGHSEDSRQTGIQEISTGNDTGKQFPVESGRTKSERVSGPDDVKPVDGGETSGSVSGGVKKSSSNNGYSPNDPCISTRPPTANEDLFPGISTSAEE